MDKILIIYMNKNEYKISSYEKKVNIMIFFLIIFIKIINMQTEQYCKLISFSKDNYYIITQKEIKFYIKTKKLLKLLKLLKEIKL